MAELSGKQKAKLSGALKRHYKVDVAYGKGGFFVRGKGHITVAQARRVTGVKAPARPRKAKTGGYGDYAILRKIAGRV